jgi:hypothetical protein
VVTGPVVIFRQSAGQTAEAMTGQPDLSGLIYARRTGPPDFGASWRRRSATDDLGRHVLYYWQSPPQWPNDLAVPLPSMRGRQREAQVGTEEGSLCLRGEWCQGRLVLRSRDGAGCYCGAVHAPCPACMSRVPECPVCYHREDEPE